MESCAICLKHAGGGPLAVGPRVWEDPLVVVSHEAEGFLGHLYVETKRHAAYLADLSDDEAARVGWATTRSAKALRSELDTEFVFAAVVGTAIPHFHEHVIVRRRGTPAELRWHEVDDWTDAPTGTSYTQMLWMRG